MKGIFFTLTTFRSAVTIDRSVFDTSISHVRTPFACLAGIENTFTMDPSQIRLLRLSRPQQLLHRQEHVCFRCGLAYRLINDPIIQSILVHKTNPKPCGKRFGLYLDSRQIAFSLAQQIMQSEPTYSLLLPRYSVQIVRIFVYKTRDLKLIF